MAPAIKAFTALRLLHFARQYRDELRAQVDAGKGTPTSARVLVALDKVITEADAQLDPGPVPSGMYDRNGNVR
jgi:hypothetical protein